MMLGISRFIACIAFIAGLVLVAHPSTAEAVCKGKRNVLVKARTPVRRGPGLNYGVASFLEKAICAKYSEVSLDENWVLVEIGKRFGWVPVKRLSKPSRRRLKRAVQTGPVGSGQARGAGRLKRQSVLLERPEPRAPVRRVLPENLSVLPLAQTRDGQWTQVRDERGDIGWMPSADLAGRGLARLPRTAVDNDGLSSRQPPPEPRAPSSTRRVARNLRATDQSTEASRSFAAPEGPSAAETKATRVARRAKLGGQGVGVRVAAFGAFLNPVHSLDSNGVDRIRRYDLSAASPGAGIEVEIPRLGPLGLRLGYALGFLSGVAADDEPGTGEAGGMQHDAFVRAGWPFMLGGVQLTPELGYHFGMFDFDTILAGQNQVVFLSTQSHLGSLGLRLQSVLLDGLILDGDAAALVGITQESPRELGDAGITVGVAAQLGFRYIVASAWSLVLRYGVNYRSTGYTGEAQLDPTITEATLTDLSHGVLAGVAIDL